MEQFCVFFVYFSLGVVTYFVFRQGIEMLYERKIEKANKEADKDYGWDYWENEE